MANTLIKKFAPLNVSKVTVPSSDKMFYTAGGRRNYPLWQVVDEFGTSYYSGLDVSVYFGDIFVDEIVQISFSEMENVKPCFGYASYVFNCVVHGSRLVQGSFAINFKDAGYIPLMLSKLAEPAEVQKSIKDISIAQMDNTAKLAREAKDQGTYEIYAQANQLFTDTFKQAQDKPTQLAISRDLTLEDIVNGKALKDKSGNYLYSNMVNQLKEEHWGTSTTAGHESEQDPDMARAKYGLQTSSMSPGFDIVIKYGQPEDYYDHRPGWGTLECIKNCHITGFQKAIDDSGRNIIEVYNFIAQTIA